MWHPLKSHLGKTCPGSVGWQGPIPVCWEIIIIIRVTIIITMMVIIIIIIIIIIQMTISISMMFINIKKNHNDDFGTIETCEHEPFFLQRSEKQDRWNIQSQLQRFQRFCSRISNCVLFVFLDVLTKMSEKRSRVPIKKMMILFFDDANNNEADDDDRRQ